MGNIQMVDLQGQYLRLKGEIDTAVESVMLAGNFIKGPEVAKFEAELKDYTGAAHVIGCANGTDALQIALMALQLPAGSEIITPSFSYAALAEVILLLGFKPVFIEVNPSTFLMEPSAIEAAITPKTRVIAPVHLYGQICNMEAIMEIANKHNLTVMEDNAQAIGAVYRLPGGVKKQAGTIGHIGTTSFFPSKNLGCYGDGGAIFTNDDALAETIRMIANHGQKVKYKHEIIGVNSRLDTIQAAILRVKLKNLSDFEWKRNQCADFYDRELSGISALKIPARAENSTHVFHQYTLTVETEEIRNSLKNHLTNAEIPCMVYYPTPLHQQPAYVQDIEMPLTETLCKRVLSLPIHTEMKEEQLQFITSKIKEYFN